VSPSDLFLFLERSFAYLLDYVVNFCFAVVHVGGDVRYFVAFLPIPFFYFARSKNFYFNQK
jgi:hypothetical protein